MAEDIIRAGKLDSAFYLLNPETALARVTLCSNLPL
jgi:hypothetical protein